VLNSRYRIVALLGKGGFGAVYRAWDVSLRKQCAVKQNFETSQQAHKQFQREAVILAGLDNPHLPRVTDHFTLPGEGQFLVMDYVEGEDLQEMINARRSPFPENQVLAWMVQVCDALDYLHRQNPPIIHRDIKPANIKITAQGQVYLVDFGIAKVYDPGLKTTIGAKAVTPGFSPPEQYGSAGTDPRTDIYALGATLYSLCTGLEPLESTQRFGADPLIPADQANPNLSHHFANAIQVAMQLDPSRRFQSVADFKAVLTGGPGRKSYTVSRMPQGGDTQAFTTQAIPQRGTRIQPINKWVLWAAGLVILVLASALVFSLANPPTPGPITTISTRVGEIIFTTTSSPAFEPTTAPLTLTETEILPPQDLETLTPTESETPSPSPTLVSSWKQGKLVFVYDNGSSRALYTYDLVGDSSPRLLIDPGAGTWFLAPSWSPDTRMIAYHQYNGRMQVISAGGSTSPRSLHDCNVPSWSPDGGRILCKRNGGDAFDIVDAGSGSLLRSIPVESGASLPAWSPSGGEFAFVINQGSQYSIWVSPLDGGSPWLVAGDSQENYAPSWSPDGGKIAYQSRVNSTLSEIWVVDRDGANPQRVTFTPDGYWSRAPSWSPDGEWLVFVSDQVFSTCSECGEIYAVSLLTQELLRITDTGGRVYNWRVSWGG
jgi:serine/threonine protein kinase